MRSTRDHEVRSWFTSTDYSRAVSWAGVQDRSISNFVEHAVRRYMDSLDEQDAARRECGAIPGLRRKSDEIG